jgi:hypothetical protein
MPEHTRNDEAESFDLTVRCPGVAFDVGQKGFARVLVVQRLADSVAEYDDRRAGGEKGQLEYFKNALVGATPDDTMYQCVYLTDNPVNRDGLNDPKNRYPVPESRLIPLRHDRADPVDDSPQWSPREAVQAETLEYLFDIALTDADTPLDEDALEQAATRAGINTDVIRSAREASESFADDFHDDVTLDDSDGPHMQLTDAEAVEELGGGASTDFQGTDGPKADSESEGDHDDPPDPPEDGGPDDVADLDDGELGDFDPSDDL